MPLPESVLMSDERLPFMELFFDFVKNNGIKLIDKWSQELGIKEYDYYFIPLMIQFAILSDTDFYKIFDSYEIPPILSNYIPGVHHVSPEDICNHEGYFGLCGLKSAREYYESVYYGWREHGKKMLPEWYAAITRKKESSEGESFKAEAEALDTPETRKKMYNHWLMLLKGATQTALYAIILRLEEEARQFEAQAAQIEESVGDISNRSYSSETLPRTSTPDAMSQTSSANSAILRTSSPGAMSQTSSANSAMSQTSSANSDILRRTISPGAMSQTSSANSDWSAQPWGQERIQRVVRTTSPDAATHKLAVQKAAEETAAREEAAEKALHARVKNAVASQKPSVPLSSQTAAEQAAQNRAALGMMGFIPGEGPGRWKVEKSKHSSRDEEGARIADGAAQRAFLALGGQARIDRYVANKKATEEALAKTAAANKAAGIRGEMGKGGGSKKYKKSRRENKSKRNKSKRNKSKRNKSKRNKSKKKNKSKTEYYANEIEKAAYLLSMKNK